MSQKVIYTISSLTSQILTWLVKGRQKGVKNPRTLDNFAYKSIQIVAIKHDRRAQATNLFQKDDSKGMKKKQKPFHP